MWDRIVFSAPYTVLFVLLGGLSVAWLIKAPRSEPQEVARQWRRESWALLVMGTSFVVLNVTSILSLPGRPLGAAISTAGATMAMLCGLAGVRWARQSSQLVEVRGAGIQGLNKARLVIGGLIVLAGDALLLTGLFSWDSIQGPPLALAGFAVIIAGGLVAASPRARAER